MTAPLAALLRAILVWILIMLGESAHGALRRVLFSADALFALRQVSVAIGVVIVFCITWFCMPWMKLASTRAALAVGALWVVLTAAFEAALARVLGLGWEHLLAEYDPSRGGFMLFGLLAMSLTPWLVMRLQAAPSLPRTP
jgi:hypothetical protein